MKLILKETVHLESLFDSMPLYLQRRLKIRDLLYFDSNLDKYIREIPPLDSFKNFCEAVVFQMLHHFVLDVKDHEIQTRLDPEYGVVYDDNSLDKVFGMYWELEPLLIERYKMKLKMAYNNKINKKEL